MHTNSKVAYDILLPHLTEREREVLEIYEDGNKYTDREVADRLNRERSSITGRIGALISKKQIEEVGKIYINGRPHRVCKLINQYE